MIDTLFVNDRSSLFGHTLTTYLSRFFPVLSLVSEYDSILGFVRLPQTL